MMSQADPPSLPADFDCSDAIQELAHVILARHGSFDSVWDIANRVCDEYANSQANQGCRTTLSVSGAEQIPSGLGYVSDNKERRLDGSDVLGMTTGLPTPRMGSSSATATANFVSSEHGLPARTPFGL